MSNLTIFKDPNAVAVGGGSRTTALGQSLAATNVSRRIQTNTNGTFKRLVNGEQIGNAIRGEFNAIIVDALPRVSRTFYAGNYDPNAKPTLPDCWSNLGEKPESTAPSPQSASCATCTKNIKGSGDNGGRACRYQRRIAILLATDPTGEVYQFNIPAKSLFGKGSGNVHPFESYVKFLLANGESPDTVVTNISYDLNADSMELLFTPLRGLDEKEYALVVAAQNDPETKRYTQLVVAQVEGATKTASGAPVKEATPEPTPATVERSDEPDDEEEAVAPVKRANTKKATASVAAKPDLAAVLDEWGFTSGSEE